jgi:hypothetical protein
MKRIKIAAGLLVCFSFLISGEPRVTLSGTVQIISTAGSKIKRPFEGASVRLCSLERILQTETDRTGIFRFVDVPPGTYDVMAAGKGWLPRVLKGVELKGVREEPVEIDMAMGDAGEMPACFRYDAQDCSNTKFYVDYDVPHQQKVGLIRGLVTAPTSRRKERGVSAAKATLFRAGTKEPLSSKIADKTGQFIFEVQPGIYELIVSRKGFQEACVKQFLVPRENTTNVTVKTARVGWVQLCVDETMRAANRHPANLPAFEAAVRGDDSDHAVFTPEGRDSH